MRLYISFFCLISRLLVLSSKLMLLKSSLIKLFLKGGWALLMTPPCLESHGYHLIPSFYFKKKNCLPPLFLFCIVLLLIPSCLSFFWPILLLTVRKSLQTFFLQIGVFAFPFFSWGFWRLADDKLVGGQFSVIPYGTSTNVNHFCIYICIFFDFLMMSVDNFLHVLVNWYC